MTKLHRKDHTLAELQELLPWGFPYSREFESNEMPHKHFSHALTHIVKACGYLHGMLDDMDHGTYTESDSVKSDAAKYLADIVISVLRAANTLPQGRIELQQAVKERLESKNNIKLQAPWNDEAANHIENFYTEVTGELPTDDQPVAEIVQCIMRSIST